MEVGKEHVILRRRTCEEVEVPAGTLESANLNHKLLVSDSFFCEQPKLLDLD